MKHGRIVLLCLAFPAFAFGQEFRATISGAAADPSGGVVQGAKITITEIHTKTKAQTVSDASGHYALPFLAPGEYELQAEASGFKGFDRKNIELSAGDHPTIDIQFAIGATTQTVQVTEAIPLLNTQNASSGQSISTKEVEELPLNGRTPMMLAQLSVGVIPTGQPALVHPFDSGGAAAWSIGGTPSQTSELLLDGSPDATWDIRLAYSPPQDAVREVSVKAFDSDAAYGHTGGGTANQILKGGTNSLHGSLYEFTQPSNLTANTFFNDKLGLGNPLTHYNQYGLTAGGPMIVPRVYNGKNKLFWFFAWEGLKDSQPNTTSLTVPTDAERKGDFSALLAAGTQYQLYNPFSATQSGSTITRSPLPGNIIPGNLLNPIALAYLKFYPEPNVTLGVGPTGVNNFGSNATTNDDYNNELGRLDWNMSDRSHMAFDIRRTGYNQTKNNYFNNVAEGSLLFRDNWGASLDEVYTLNPTTVIDARGNFTRMAETHSLPSAGFNPSQLGFPSYLASNSEFLQLPIASLSTYQSLGASGANQIPSQSVQFFGDLVKVKGEHTLKAGTDARQYRLNTISYGNSTGSFSFGNTWDRSASNSSSTVAQGQDLASFLLGLPTSGSYDLNTFGSFYSYYLAGFVQDDWRVKSNLTLNLGVRYDWNGPYNETYGRSVNGFDTQSANPLAPAAIAAYNRAPIPEIPAGGFAAPGGLTFASPGNTAVYQNTSHLVSPRIGFSWSPTRLHNQTVVRGGFGIFVAPVTIADLSLNGKYSTSPILNQEGFSQTTPMVVTNDNFLTPASTLGNPFASGIQHPEGSAAGLGTFVGQSVSFLNPNVKNPYSLRWNFGIQHTFTPNLMLEVIYTGNHSVHLPVSVTQLNGIPRQYLSTLPVRDNAVNTTLTATVANPFAGLIPGQTLNGTTTSVTQLLAHFPEFPVGDASGGWSGSSGVLEDNLDIGSSYFNSLNVHLEKRLSHGLLVTGNYIYSRLIESDSWLNDSDPRLEKRVSPFDFPHRFVVGASYELPFGKGQAFSFHSRWANLAAGGWHLNGIYTYQMGAPVTWVNGSSTAPGDYVYYGGPGALVVDPRQTNTVAFDKSLFATNSNQAFAYHLRTFSTTFPNIRTDGVNELDTSVLKRFDVAEQRYLELRFEFFNAVNHPTFAAPDTRVTNAAFGTITSQADRPRTIQLGARIVF